MSAVAEGDLSADEAGSEYGDEDDDDGRSPLVIDHRSKPRAFNLQQHVITPPSEPEGCRRSKRQRFQPLDYCPRPPGAVKRS